MFNLIKIPFSNLLPQAAAPLVCVTLALLLAVTFAPGATHDFCTLVLSRLCIFFSSQAA